MANIANQTKRMQTSSFRDSRAGTGMKGDAKAVGVAAGGCAADDHGSSGWPHDDRSDRACQNAPNAT